MTLTLEHTPSIATRTRGDEALAIIDAYRTDFEDATRVETIDTEFPYYAQHLGLRGVHLACAGDNLAGAFKWRGAIVGASHLKEQGVDTLVVPSAGNHARGAVLAAKALDLGVHVVVPRSAPPAKRDKIKELWDDPALHIHIEGESFDESLAWAYARPELGALLHPYDDPYVARGQGTVVDDILSEMPEAETIVVPVGGGGLLAGVLERLQELGRTDVKVVAAEAERSTSLSQSLANNQLTATERPNMRYGGSAVKKIGAHTLAICRNSQNLEVVAVPDSDVNELSDLYEQARTDLLRTDTPNYEPTSLVAVAALKQLRQRENMVVVGTGHNDTIYPQREPRNYRVPV